jgi:hypothetical protein
MCVRVRLIRPDCVLRSREWERRIGRCGYPRLEGTDGTKTDPALASLQVPSGKDK